MQLLKSERFLFLVIITVLMLVITLIGYKTYQNNELMLVERDKVGIVKTCIDNEVACSLIYESTEDIPLE